MIFACELNKNWTINAHFPWKIYPVSYLYVYENEHIYPNNLLIKVWVCMEMLNTLVSGKFSTRENLKRGNRHLLLLKGKQHVSFCISPRPYWTNISVVCKDSTYVYSARTGRYVFCALKFMFVWVMWQKQ